MYRNGIKRLLAVILSLGGMICLSPLLLVLCIAIKRCFSSRNGWASTNSISTS